MYTEQNTSGSEHVYLPQGPIEVISRNSVYLDHLKCSLERSAKYGNNKMAATTKWRYDLSGLCRISSIHINGTITDSHNNTLSQSHSHTGTETEHLKQHSQFFNLETVSDSSVCPKQRTL